MKIENEECIKCKYRDWDCKNCFLNIGEGDNLNVTLFFIMTRQCNFRCNYCAIDFSDDSLSYEIIDKYIDFIKNNRTKINELRIEFFGGEPLLEFDKIKYIIENTISFSVYSYSLITNGFLFDYNILNYLISKNVKIIFSVALHNKDILKDKKELFKKINLDIFVINLIIEPSKEKYIYNIFKELISLGFKNMNLLFIRYTKTRSKVNLLNLELLLIKLRNTSLLLYNKGLKLDIFNFSDNGVGYEKNKNDLEIVFDYNGKMYIDLETELFFVRDLVSKKVFNKTNVYLGNINKNNLDLYNFFYMRNNIKLNLYKNNIIEHLGLNEVDSALNKLVCKYKIKS